MADWHNKTCSRLDATQVGNLISCLSCGSCKEFAEELKEDEFSYPPIRQRTEIRLLSIHAGEFNSPIYCDIFTRNVVNADYEAISYTWADDSGDKSKCKTIILSDTPFTVTKNCEMALRRVRRKFSNRCIWIDAVCIDQTNLDERGHQVQLMPQIYSRAMAVLIYIGESANGSASTLRDIFNGQGTKFDLPAAAFALEDLLSRNYFSRVWVLQEIALAKKADLIWGDLVMPWQVFQPHRLSSLQLLKNHENSETQLNGARIPPALYFNSRVYSQPDQFMNLLDFASSCSAEDPRDKVYSLLGLVLGPQSQDLAADYKLTVQEVYTQTAFSLGCHFGWGPVFNQALVRKSRVANLPSWVPDWSVGRSNLKITSGPWPKPLQVYPTSKTIIFRALDYKTREWTLSKPSLETPNIHYLFDLEDDNTDYAQNHLYFPTESSLFCHLGSLPRRDLTTKPIFGTYEMLDSQHPAYKITKKGIRLWATDLDRKSRSWSYISISDIKECLNMSCLGLLEMLHILKADLPLDLVKPMKEWGLKADCLYFQITAGNFDEMISNLRVSNAQSAELNQETSTEAFDSYKIPTQMALQLLVENYRLEHAVCIL